MQDHHEILRRLQRRENIEENLNRMTALTKDAAYRFARILFAFHDMTFFEGLGHRNEENPFSDLIDGLVRMKEDYLAGREVPFDVLCVLRSENEKRMEELTRAVDLFTLLEYVQNRIEYRFVSDGGLSAGYSDEAETDRILSYLAAQPKDTQNSYIYRIVEQLPVRMTKNRFYETVRERLSVYKGIDTAAFDGVLASLRSAACTKGLSSPVAGHEDLSALFGEMSLTEENKVDGAVFERWQAALHEAGTRIERDMDCSQALQNVLNAFGAVLLARYEGTERPAEEPLTDTILRTVAESFGKDAPDLAAAYDACRALEGTLEDAGDRYFELQGAAEELSSRFVYDDADLKKLGVLLSDSSYASLDRNAFVSGRTVGDELFEQSAEALINELSAYFATLPRSFVRASMARVFTILPPRFSGQEELHRYIGEALSGCHDAAEKRGVLELLDGIMKER